MTQSLPRRKDFESDLRGLLRTESIGSTVRAFESVDSTNTIAAEWGGSGAPHGALVFAEYQSRGRGRFGRAWQARPGLNLTFSIVLRPELGPDQLGLVTIAACVAAADAIEALTTPTRPTIKWPNDVLLNGRKCCGMLLETSVSKTNEHPVVVLGTGLNVNQDSFPQELSDRATSLLLETGQLVDRMQLLADICDRIERRLEQAKRSSAELRRDYMARMTDIGAPVRLHFSSAEGGVQGVTLGLDESGGLILQTDAGPRVFHAGEVTRSL